MDTAALTASLAAAAAWLVIGVAGLLRPASLYLASRVLFPAGAAVGFALAAFAAPVQAETWKSLPLMDGHCIAKMADAPDAHPRSCALQSGQRSR